jgi:YfiH family protein
MPFREKDSLRYYTFESLDDEGVLQGAFTRHGGVSPSPWAKLNLGSLVGDDLENVLENRQRIFQAIGRKTESIFDVWQVHGTSVVCAESPRPLTAPHQKADVILTDNPQITLLMRFADCVPILYFDPIHRVVGLAHAGWQGTVRYVAEAAVKTMQHVYGSRSEDILVAIGPSIGMHHYEVGEDVITEVEKSFGSDANNLLPVQDGAVKFDLWAANRLVLEKAGIRCVEVAGLCTACHTTDWYSHRGEQGKTGRFGVIIGLRE